MVTVVLREREIAAPAAGGALGELDAGAAFQDERGLGEGLVDLDVEVDFRPFDGADLPAVGDGLVGLFEVRGVVVTQVDQSCQGQNTENVYLVEGDVPRGTYRVSVRLAKMGSEPSPLRVRFSARVGQRTWSAVLEFRVAKEQKVLTFEL